MSSAPHALNVTADTPASIAVRINVVRFMFGPVPIKKVKLFQERISARDSALSVLTIAH
jgi:hypothetical protein